jgi:hypothetical protein
MLRFPGLTATGHCRDARYLIAGRLPEAEFRPLFWSRELACGGASSFGFPKESIKSYIMRAAAWP